MDNTTKTLRGHHREMVSDAINEQTTLKVNAKSNTYELVSINELKANKLNAEVYGDKYLTINQEYIVNLAISIAEHGLDHPMEVCKDGKTLIGGHHRWDAMKILEFISSGFCPKVPVIKTNYDVNDFDDAKSRLNIMNMLVRNNMQNTYTLWQRYEQAQRWLVAYEEANGRKAGNKDFDRNFGNSIGFKHINVVRANRLEHGYGINTEFLLKLEASHNLKKNHKKYKDIIKKINKGETFYVKGDPAWLNDIRGYAVEKDEDGKWVPRKEKDGKIKYKSKTRTFKSTYDTQFEDAVKRFRLDTHQERTVHSAFVNMPEFQKAVKEALKGAQKWVKTIIDYKAENFCGQDVSLGNIQDVNTMSGMLHGGVTKLLPIALEKYVGIKANAPDDRDGGSHFDIVAKEQPATGGYEWQLEIKSNIGESAINWTSSSDKLGYCLFIRADQNFDNFFAAYVYVPEKYPVIEHTKHTNKFGKTKDVVYKPCWTGGGAIKTKKLSKGCLSTLVNGMFEKFPKHFNKSIDKLRDDEWLDYFPGQGKVIHGTLKETTDGVKRTIDIGLEPLVKEKSSDKKIKKVPNISDAKIDEFIK